MKSKKTFIYIFRKYPLIRACSYVGIIGIALLCMVLFTSRKMHAPVVSSINPAVGAPGDTMTIEGEWFGQKDTSSYVKIDGNRITSSAYLLWSNTKIRIVLPRNVEDGLVYVVTKEGVSEPYIFANIETIPVLFKQDAQMTVPVIENLDHAQIPVGDVLSISGVNFGELKGNSVVLFSTSEIDDKGRPIMMECSSFDHDYQFWSATEIQVRIPDGAVSGSVIVKTDRGQSVGFPLKIYSSAGKKTWSNKRTYILSLKADVSDAVVRKNSMITLFLPRPKESSVLRGFTITKSNPKPSMINFMGTVVHQLPESLLLEKKVIEEDYVLNVWESACSIAKWNVSAYSSLTKKLYAEYLREDFLIHSDDERIISLVQSILKKERNPYIKASILYDYMVKNYSVLNELRAGDADVLDLLEIKEGDAYDYAVLYTTLLRAAGIPAITNAGVYVTSDMRAINHWWCEFYLEDIGWIPADPSMGDNLTFENTMQNEKDDYFARLDSRHIAFSRGWNDIKPAFGNSKRVYRPKTWALQSIWEEASYDVDQYSSFWSDVIIKGIY